MEEKRATRRKPLVSDLRIFSRDRLSGIGIGHVVDLSDRGLRMLTDRIFNIGDELCLHFSVPQKWSFDFAGRVVHREDAIGSNAYGIKFFDGQGTFVLKLL